MNGYRQLHPYQLKAIDFILDKKKCALYLGMGLGKTIIALTAIVELLNKRIASKVLIIGPLRVVNNVWHTELSKWYHTQGISYSIITGTLKQRTQAINTSADIYLINRENVAWLREIENIRWDIIVLDESSSFKNPSSKRFKVLKTFEYNYMIQLTGTPSPNGLLDIWSQVYLLDKGQRLGKAMYIYTQNYFTPDYRGYNMICRNPEAIYKKISDITLSMKSEDYITLPPKIELITYVDIGEHELYKELQKEFLATIQKKDIIAVNAASLSGKLLQFCNGAIYDADKNVIEIHDAKLDALEEIIEGNPNDNILVAYNFISDLKRIKTRFKSAVILDKESSQIDKWNQGKIKLMLCHPASSGKGLNLQEGGNILVWFGLTWNLEDYLQFNARLHRQGQTKPVAINHIIAKGCIDEVVMKMLTEKKVSLYNLLESLKERSLID